MANIGDTQQNLTYIESVTTTGGIDSEGNLKWMLVALCKDGSVWTMQHNSGLEWQCINGS